MPLAQKVHQAGSCLQPCIKVRQACCSQQARRPPPVCQPWDTREGLSLHFPSPQQVSTRRLAGYTTERMEKVSARFAHRTEYTQKVAGSVQFLPTRRQAASPSDPNRNPTREQRLLAKNSKKFTPIQKAFLSFLLGLGRAMPFRLLTQANNSRHSRHRRGLRSTPARPPQSAE